MKIRTLLTLLTSITLLSFTGPKELSNYVEELKACETSQQYMEIAQKFDKLSTQSDENWYPAYYAAYSYVLAAYSSEDYSTLDKTLDRAERSLERAESISAENDEILCVYSMINSARIMVNPAERGYLYGQKSAMFLEKARIINPQNPRTLFLMAQAKMYMPATYGGGCENAKSIINAALEAFDAFEKKDENAPDWGKKETEELLKKCS